VSMGVACGRVGVLFVCGEEGWFPSCVLGAHLFCTACMLHYLSHCKLQPASSACVLPSCL
jgi:hypothetical protein